MPYLNRAIAKEQVGLEEAEHGHDATAVELWEQAISDCDRAIQLDPKEYAAWFDRGNVHMRLGDYAAALVDFRTAADLAPGLAGTEGGSLSGAAATSTAGAALPCAPHASGQQRNCSIIEAAPTLHTLAARLSPPRGNAAVPAGRRCRRQTHDCWAGS